jgi:hypothetical protein
MRSMTPELPENPLPYQVQAWVKLTELSQDPDFRAKCPANGRRPGRAAEAEAAG